MIADALPIITRRILRTKLNVYIANRHPVCSPHMWQVHPEIAPLRHDCSRNPALAKEEESVHLSRRAEIESNSSATAGTRAKEASAIAVPRKFRRQFICAEKTKKCVVYHS